MPVLRRCQRQRNEQCPRRWAGLSEVVRHRAERDERGPFLYLNLGAASPAKLFCVCSQGTSPIDLPGVVARYFDLPPVAHKFSLEKARAFAKATKRAVGLPLTVDCGYGQRATIAG